MRRTRPTSPLREIMRLKISRGPGALRNVAGDQAEIAGEEIRQVRAQIQLPFLRQLKGSIMRFRDLPQNRFELCGVRAGRLRIRK